MKYKISVIIPVYNVEEYIEECLDSIINQTIGIENIEVILINDCTPDNSMEIVWKYAEKYSSIKIIEHDVNQGQGPARNTGLKYVTGEYITFVDSDDFISENTYEVCLEKFEKHNCDLVIYEYDYYAESGRKYPRNPSGILFEEDKLIKNIAETPEIVFSTSVCNKVFPKKFNDILNFPSTRYEDMVPAITAIFSSEKIYVTNQCKYYYRKREDENKSTTDDFLEKTDSYRDRILIHYELYTLLEKYPDYKPLIDWINARDTRVFIRSLMLKDDFSHKERKEIFFIAKEYMEDVSEETLHKVSKYWMEVLKDIQNKSYWGFFFKYRIYNPKIKSNFKKLKKNLLLFYQRTFKVIEILVLILISLVYRLSPKYKRIWLFSERETEAKDNGYRFFQYMRENYPEINSYYLIDKNYKEDYNRIKPLGNIIQFGSWKHKLFFILSEKLVSAHKDVIEPWNYRNFKKYFHKLIPEKKYVFLQHGIIKDDVSNVLGKKNPNNYFDLFICGAKPEYEYIDTNYGYIPGEVVYTGLARFDYLHNIQTKNQILIMPTWRKGIVQPSWVKRKVVDDEKFLNSEYYEVYQSLINNEKLIELLEKNNFTLIFYPHYEVQQYIKYFTSSSDRVILANKELYDVQTLLIESKLLITDFSSIYFDFAYMNKPLVYYQFDKDSFFENHYKKGYFSYEEHGFGPVLETEDEVINSIEKTFDNNFIVEDKYKRRTNEFFVLKDTKNCERIYTEIIKLENHYIAVDNLITEIFDEHTEKFTVNGLNVYKYGSFLMYVVTSKKKVKDKISLHVFPEDHNDLVNTQLDFINLDFFFDDLCVSTDKRSSYKNENIAIVKLPDIKISYIKTGKTNKRKKSKRNILEIDLKTFPELNQNK